MAVVIVAERCLQNHRYCAEGRLVNEPGEEIERDMTLTEICMAISACSQLVTGVVEVDAGGLPGAKQLVHLTQEVTIARFLMQRIAGGKGMTGIETHADTIL